MSANPEDLASARCIARRLRPDTTSSMTDAELDADPIVQWVACLFRAERDRRRAVEAALAREQTFANSILARLRHFNMLHHVSRK